MLDAFVHLFWVWIGPHLWWILTVLIAVAVLRFPMLGRGPDSSRYRDPWRTYRFAARDQLMARAGNRCEAPRFFAWGRCVSPAAEADHVMPWSQGGPTVLSNGQALCRGHNRSKGALTPPWWYVMGLEKRRRGYFPTGVDPRVVAVLGEGDHAARAQWQAGKNRK